MNPFASAALLLTILLSSGPVAADPPAISGIVTRDQIPAAFTWVDFDSGLRVIVGADIDEFCAGNLNFDLVEVTDKVPASGRIIELLKGTVQTTVWDFLDFDCALFTTIDPVASGDAKLRSTDNDLEGTAPDDRNTNAWGFMAHGRLEGLDGTRMSLNAFIRYVFGNSSGFHVTSKVVLN